MKKLIAVILSVIIMASLFTLASSAALVHMVVRGDTMWKIAKTYEVGLSELASKNPHIKNPSLIYPGDVLTVPTVDGEVLAYEARVIELVNSERTSRGLSPLTYDWQLARVARIKSEDMSSGGYFSHTSPTYGTPFEMIQSFGISYKSAGENIARGYASPESVVRGWMNSSGHRANILNSSFTHIGVGYAPGGSYATQLFIRK